MCLLYSDRFFSCVTLNTLQENRISHSFSASEGSLIVGPVISFEELPAFGLY